MLLTPPVRRFVRLVLWYALNGGTGYLVDFLLFTTFTHRGLNRFASSALAYLLALILTFVGSHFIVFRSTENPRKTVLPYIALGGTCQVIALFMQALGQHLVVSPSVSRLLTYPLLVVVSLFVQVKIFARDSRCRTPLGLMTEFLLSDVPKRKRPVPALPAK